MPFHGRRTCRGGGHSGHPEAPVASRPPPSPPEVPQMSSLQDVVATGVARISWALFLFRQTMGYFEEQLASLRT